MQILTQSGSLMSLSLVDDFYNVGEGISKLGELVDLGVKAEIIDKAGSWFAYKDQKIGQGRENVKNFLRDNPPIAQEIENRILENAGVVEKAMMEGEIKPKAKEEKAEE